MAGFYAPSLEDAAPEFMAQKPLGAGAPGPGCFARLGPAPLRAPSAPCRAAAALRGRHLGGAVSGAAPVAAAPAGSLPAARFRRYLPRRHRAHRPAAGPADVSQAVLRL